MGALKESIAREQGVSGRERDEWATRQGRPVDYLSGLCSHRMQGQTIALPLEGDHCVHTHTHPKAYINTKPSTSMGRGNMSTYLPQPAVKHSEIYTSTPHTTDH